MSNWILRMKKAFVSLHREDEGQDLIEYALLAALIALGAIAGMGYIASMINKAFSNIGNTLSSAIP